MNKLDELKTNKTIFFNFMKEKYPVISKSNMFLRDIQYAIISYFEKKDIKVNYSDAEKLAFDFTEYLELNQEITRLNKNTWKVNFFFESPVIKEIEESEK